MDLRARGLAWLGCQPESNTAKGWAEQNAGGPGFKSRRAHHKYYAQLNFFYQRKRDIRIIVQK